MRKIILFGIAVVLFLPVIGQYRAKKEANANDARDNFSKGNFKGSLIEYTELLKSDPKNTTFHYRTALCYLNLNTDKSKAITHLEFVIKQAGYDKQALLELGKAYHYAYRFDEAIEILKRYKEELGKKGAAIIEADKLIAYCFNAKELIKFPQNVSFENLGKEINTEFPDYYPFVSSDENDLIFTSRRKGNIGGFETIDGYFTSDIYISKEKNGNWSKAKNMGANVNSDGDDEAVGIADEGKYLFIYSENAFEYGDILASLKKGKSYQRRELLDQNINTNALEVAGSISPDGNILLFSSDKDGGQGELDIFMSRKLPTGNWGVATNLSNLNSKYNEDFPMFSSDGKVIYFCSQGHNSMGGFDLFKSNWDEQIQEWMNPVNLGFPINTPEDNMTISFARTGTHAYISAYREDSFGDLDIYKVSFNAAEPVVTTIKGTIKAEMIIDDKKYKNFHVYKKDNILKDFPDEYHPPKESLWKFVETKKMEEKKGFIFKTILIFEKNGVELTVGPEKIPTDPAFKFKDIKNILVKIPGYVPSPELIPTIETEIVGDAFITLTNKKTNEVFGTYLSQSSGKFIIIAPPAIYTIQVEAKGYNLFKDDLIIFDKASFISELQKDIILKKE